jgi:hypothetical protein
MQKAEKNAIFGAIINICLFKKISQLLINELIIIFDQ